MSYIRSTTNPEGLYIWHDITDGLVHWVWNVEKPLSNGRGFTVPLKDMHAVALRYADSFESIGRSGRLSARERHVYLSTGRVVGSGKKSVWIKAIADGKRIDTAWLVRVDFKDTYVHLWPVTWEYVVRGIVERESVGKKAKP